MPFPLYQEAVEKVLGRPVYTDEFKKPERLISEYEAIKSADGCQTEHGPEMAQ
jgi:hypothetical protein